MVPLEPSPLTHLGLDFEALLDSSSLNPDCTADLTLLVRIASLLCTPRSHGQSPLYHKFQVFGLDPPLTPRLERSLSFSPFKYSIIHSGSRTLPPKKKMEEVFLNIKPTFLNIKQLLVPCCSELNSMHAGFFSLLHGVWEHFTCSQNPSPISIRGDSSDGDPGQEKSGGPGRHPAFI